MNCPKCNGTGRLSFAYTNRYKVGYRCDYEGCINGIVHCCDGIQEQPTVFEMKKPKSTAERKREWRKRLKDSGLFECRVVIPDTDEAKEAIREKAEQLTKKYEASKPEPKRLKVRLIREPEPEKPLRGITITKEPEPEKPLRIRLIKDTDPDK